MKALVYHGPGSKAWEEVPDPGIQQPTDVVIHVGQEPLSAGREIRMVPAEQRLKRLQQREKHPPQVDQGPLEPQ